MKRKSREEQEDPQSMQSHQKRKTSHLNPSSSGEQNQVSTYKEEKVVEKKDVSVIFSQVLSIILSYACNDRNYLEIYYSVSLVCKSLHQGLKNDLMLYQDVLPNLIPKSLIPFPDFKANPGISHSGVMHRLLRQIYLLNHCKSLEERAIFLRLCCKLYDQQLNVFYEDLRKELSTHMKPFVCNVKRDSSIISYDVWWLLKNGKKKDVNESDGLQKEDEEYYDRWYQDCWWKWKVTYSENDISEDGGRFLNICSFSSEGTTTILSLTANDYYVTMNSSLNHAHLMYMINERMGISNEKLKELIQNVRQKYNFTSFPTTKHAKGYKILVFYALLCCFYQESFFNLRWIGEYEEETTFTSKIQLNSGASTIQSEIATLNSYFMNNLPKKKNMENKMYNLTGISKEVTYFEAIIKRIFGFLPIFDLFTCSHVSSKWSDMINWKYEYGKLCQVKDWQKLGDHPNFKRLCMFRYQLEVGALQSNHYFHQKLNEICEKDVIELSVEEKSLLLLHHDNLEARNWYQRTLKNCSSDPDTSILFKGLGKRLYFYRLIVETDNQTYHMFLFDRHDPLKVLHLTIGYSVGEHGREYISMKYTSEDGSLVYFFEWYHFSTNYNQNTIRALLDRMLDPEVLSKLKEKESQTDLDTLMKIICLLNVPDCSTCSDSKNEKKMFIASSQHSSHCYAEYMRQYALKNHPQIRNQYVISLNETEK